MAYYYPRHYILLFLLFINMPSMAAEQSDTILSTSISWDNQSAKAIQLQKLPSWKDEVIQSLFPVFLHAEHDTTQKISDNRYHISFINAYWGPIDNPFNKYPRPAKIFLIFSNPLVHEDPNIQPPQYYVAPIIHNATDGNDYVYDKNQTHPMLLNDWVESLRQKNDNHLVMTFTVCDRYGSRLGDSCSQTSYQSESEYAINLYGFNSIQKQKPALSASRLPTDSWERYAYAAQYLPTGPAHTILGDSVDWQDMAARNAMLSAVPEWTNLQVIHDNFEKIRDLRYFSDERVANFPRRISWLYPSDGCWTRASASIKDFFGPFNNPINQFTRPARIFAFGDLCANTVNTEEGQASWWFHIAAIVRDKESNQSYVLDPSINATKPLPVEEWMNAISANTGACAEQGAPLHAVKKVAVCDGYGSGPYLSCHDAKDATLRGETWDSIGLTEEYLDDERGMQKALGRNPNEVLGEHPPWKS